MIKLTNNIAPWQGMVLYLNPAHIVSIFEEANEEGGSLKTKIYCVVGGTWEVEESLNEVVRLIRRYNGEG